VREGKNNTYYKRKKTKYSRYIRENNKYNKLPSICTALGGKNIMKCGKKYNFWEHRYP
jgi:hypothetical protein